MSFVMTNVHNCNIVVSDDDCDLKIENVKNTSLKGVNVKELNLSTSRDVKGEPRCYVCCVNKVQFRPVRCSHEVCFTCTRIRIENDSYYCPNCCETVSSLFKIN